MVEFKIKSFAKIGASFTVINAFVTGYIFSTIQDIVVLGVYPKRWEYIGSFFLFGGIVFLQQDEVRNNERRAKETKKKEEEEALQTANSKIIECDKDNLKEQLIDDAEKNENPN